jgi:hypothetical protein
VAVPEHLDLTMFRGRGLQPGEELIPDGEREREMREIVIRLVSETSLHLTCLYSLQFTLLTSRLTNLS